MPYAKYRVCIDACVYCAAMCHQCADACLEEKDIHALRACIRLDQECAFMCQTTVSMMQLDGKFVEQMCQLEACDRMAAEA